MSALVLKIIAYLTMLIDHTAVSLQITGHFAGKEMLYECLRLIGRIAFPIFCFQIVQGAIHTKDRTKYLLRLILFGLLSEVPFDFALFGRPFYTAYQNVYFTLAAGLLSVYMLQWSLDSKGKNRIVRTVTWLLGTFILGFLCEFVLLSDYGWGGVFQIAFMGLLAVPAPRLRLLVRSENFYQMFICSFAVALCILLTNSAELPALLALIPIYNYNGERGRLPKGARTALYFFYPVHLLLLGIFIVLPVVRGL